MALDLIDKVGPGGEYLTSDHTLRHFKENWYPKLILRIPFDKWQQENGKDLGERANEAVRHILENHSPEPLEENLRNELKKLLEAQGA